MNKSTILIVDDEVSIVNSLARSLREDGYHILTALSGEKALLKLKNYEVDLVISDQRMPGMSGLELLKRVQLDYPETLTVMLTAYGDIETAVEAINEAGVYKFILKPWDDVDLRVTIKRALELRQLIRQKRALQHEVRRQEAILRELERRYPGITDVTRDENGGVVIELEQ